jgi:DNA repair protein RadC
VSDSFTPEGAPALYRASLARLVAEIVGTPLGPAELRRLTRLCRHLGQDPARLAHVAGIPMEAARKLLAAVELGRRFLGAGSHAADHASLSMRSPEQAAAFFANVLRGQEIEEFHVALLDSRHRLRSYEPIARGSLAHVEVHPREVFVPAVRHRAAAILCAHNHPSGDPEPSMEDILLTNRLAAAGELVGIPVLDHVIVSSGTQYVSFVARGLLKPPGRSPADK